MKLRESQTAKHVKFIILFILVLFLGSLASVLARKSGHSFPVLQNVMVFFTLIALGLFGWLSVKRHQFSLARTVFLGMLLSLASHWTLPLFHKGWEILQLIIVNSAIFAFAVFLGGCIALLFNRSKDF